MLSRLPASNKNPLGFSSTPESYTVTIEASRDPFNPFPKIDGLVSEARPTYRSVARPGVMQRGQLVG